MTKKEPCGHARIIAREKVIRVPVVGIDPDTGQRYRGFDLKTVPCTPTRICVNCRRSDYECGC